METRKIASLFAAAGFVLSLTALSFARDLHSPPSNDGTEDTVSVDLRGGGGSEDNILIDVTDGLSNDPVNPDIDTFLVKCKKKTTICADVNDNEFNDNTLHVSVVCISPATRKGFGELEYGIDGAVSDDACVTDCKEAVVSFQCEYYDFCDSTYDTVIECVGTGIVPKYPKRVE